MTTVLTRTIGSRCNTAHRTWVRRGNAPRTVEVRVDEPDLIVAREKGKEGVTLQENESGGKRNKRSVAELLGDGGKSHLSRRGKQS